VTKYAAGAAEVHGGLLGLRALAEAHYFQKAVPTHVALILDGNRRWARRRGWPPWAGHRAGADRVEEILRGMLRLGIKTVTLYVLSTENLKRSSEEVSQILALVKERAERLLTNPDIHKFRVKVKVIGKKQLLPRDVAEALEKLETATMNYDGRFLNLAIAYGGRGEILDAVREIASKVASGELAAEEINEDVFERHLYTGELPNPEARLGDKNFRRGTFKQLPSLAVRVQRARLPRCTFP
jgi:tritrans,polycis-undecaprenyl-diphosphate synthase [geranylgeranyl-diphosphate specific]